MAFGLLYDYLMGQTMEAYNYFGAHFTTKNKQDGVMTMCETVYAQLEYRGHLLMLSKFTALNTTNNA